VGLSSILVNRKVRSKLRQELGIRLGHLFHEGVSRAPLQFRPQSLELRIGADGVDLDAAVPQIPHVAGDALLLRRVTGKEAIPYSLYPAGNLKPFCLPPL
jgi:hypothetical protein